MTEQHTCHWCTRSVDPSDLHPVEAHDDDSEHPTGTILVCTECIEALDIVKALSN